MVNVHYSRARSGQVGPESYKLTWWGILLICGIVLWWSCTLKLGLSTHQYIVSCTHWCLYKSLRNDVKPRSLHHLNNVEG